MEKKILDEQFKAKDVLSPTHTNWFETGILDTLVINVTNSCNLKCSYCYANYGKFNQKNDINRNINDKTINDLFRSVEKYNIKIIKRVMFFGGEPLIAYKEINKICAEFSNLYFRKKIEVIPKYGLVTNMTQCNEEIIDLIKTYKIEITASIDGPMDIHNSQRSNSYNLVKQNYKRLQKSICAIEATYTINHIKQGISILDLKNFLSNEFNISTNLIDVVPVTNCPTLEVPSNKNEMLQETEANTEDGFIFAAFDAKKQSDLFCNAGCNRICISIDGEIYPCQIYANYSNAKLGELSNLNINDYISTLEKLPSRTRKNEKCNSCWARKFCKVCPAQSINHLIFTNDRCEIRLQKYDNLLKQCVFGKNSYNI